MRTPKKGPNMNPWEELKAIKENLAERRQSALAKVENLEAQAEKAKTAIEEAILFGEAPDKAKAELERLQERLAASKMEAEALGKALRMEGVGGRIQELALACRKEAEAELLALQAQWDKGVSIFDQEWGKVLDALRALGKVHARKQDISASLAGLRGALPGGEPLIRVTPGQGRHKIEPLAHHGGPFVDVDAALRAFQGRA